MNRGAYCCAGRAVDDRVELGESGAVDDGDRPIFKKERDYRFF